MADQTLELKVTLDNGQFKVASNEVKQGVNGTAGAAKKGAKSFDALGMAMKTAALAGAAAFVGLMKRAVQAASNLQEVTSKFRTVFKGNMAVASQAVKDLTSSYAMSTREAREYLSSVQDLLVPMGMASGEAANMSAEVVKLSGDLGSFNNLPTAQVMADIQSALVGNFETMKKYGVILNETVLKQAALEQGVWNGKGAIDASSKAQVAYSLIVKSSSAAVGDMARTQNSWANQVKKGKAQLEEFEAAMGGPIMNTLSEFAGSVDMSSDGMREFAHGLGVIVSGAIKAAGAIGKVVKVLSPLTKLIEYNIWAIKQLGKLEQQAGTGFFSKFELPTQKALQQKQPAGRKPPKSGKPGKGPEADPEIMAFAARHDMLLNYHGVKLTAEEDSAIREQERQNQAADDYERFLQSKLGMDTSYYRGLQGVVSVAGVFMAEKNKKLFMFGQGLAIAQTWMSTYQGMMKAYAQLGPIAGAAGASIIFAAGVLNTRKIATQKPPEYAVGSMNVPNTGPAVVHQGEIIVPKTMADSVRSGDASLTGGGGIQRPIIAMVNDKVLFEVNEMNRDEAAQNMGSQGSFAIDSPY